MDNISIAGSVATKALGAYGAAITARTSEKRGSLDSNKGLLGYPCAFIQIVRNQNYTPSNIDITSGEPSNSYVTLKKGMGVTKVLECHLEIPSATQDELNEIESLLKGGVILWV